MSCLEFSPLFFEYLKPLKRIFGCSNIGFAREKAVFGAE